MDNNWRFKSMEAKGWQAVSPSELAFAISNAASLDAVATGLQLLEKAWGKDELASMLVARMGPKMVSMQPRDMDSATVMSMVVSEVPFHDGKAADNWGRLGLMLDMGADPDAAPPGASSALDKVMCDASWIVGRNAEPMRQAVAMMLSRSKLAGDQAWVDKALSDYPELSKEISREWSKREANELQAFIQKGPLSAKDAARL